MFTCAEILAATGGRIIGSLTEAVSGVCSDSRSVVPGQLFVALRGERFDGHDFLDEVAEKGITAALVAENRLAGRELPGSVACVIVKDTLRAMGDLAAAFRNRFDIPVIGVTGSNGKTTVKEMLAAILDQTGPGLKTEGNLNNLIGVPRMVFQLRPEHRWAVLEMGMSEAGEIDRLAEIARPRVGIVLNALPAHLQSMGSVEAVARAKGELLNRITDGGLAVVNADDPRVSGLGQNSSAGRISFGIARGEVRAEEIEPLGMNGQRLRLVTPRGNCLLHLKVLGRHNIYNALAATAALLDRIDLETIVSGLESFTPYKGRFSPEQIGSIVLVDDSYNANPASMKAGLETLAHIAGEGHRVAVLGDMLELGEQEAEAHRGVGAVAARNSDRLFLIGKRMAAHGAEGAILAGMDPAAIVCCTGHDELSERLQVSLREGDVVLLKGSRGMTMEKVKEALKARMM